MSRNTGPIKAQQLQPVSLTSKPLESVCKDFVDGFCRQGDRCTKSHDICILEDGTHSAADPGSANAAPNYLSLGPRVIPADKCVFEEDGPGDLSRQGTRHDNDHMDIRRICILPTTDEILCLRRPYMPRKDFAQSHFLPRGYSCLVDTLFRQLRYESTECIIDACYHAAQQLAITSKKHNHDYDFSQETPRGVRYSLFRDVIFEELLFHEFKGTVVRLSFACPRTLRGSRMHSSGLFEKGMLIALLGLDEDGSSLSTTFFEVHLRQSTDAMKVRTGNDLRASVQLSLADPKDTDALRRVIYYAQGLLHGTFVLIDLPGVLLPGFSLCLRQLQNLYDSTDAAFSSFVAPPTPLSVSEIGPPVYASGRDFKYNIDSLRPQSKQNSTSALTLPLYQTRPRCSHRQPNARDPLKETTLDEGQAVALHENLSRSLAFTQGPPGTGKTYLGVSLSKTILNSQDKSNPKPILAVCMTNHALDSFLGDLKNDGITGIARLGAGSKEEWTRPFLLKELSQKMKITKIESVNLRDARLQVEGLVCEGMGWSEALTNDTLSWHAVRGILRLKYPAIFEHFASLENLGQDYTDIRIARKAGGFAYEFWCQGGDIRDLNQLLTLFDTLLGMHHSSKEPEAWESRTRERLLAKVKSNAEHVTTVFAEGNLWMSSLAERQKIIDNLKDEVNPWMTADSLAEVHRRHQAAIHRRREARGAVDRRCLAQQQVIGLTTTACARYWHLLNQLQLRVVICEEAGEVMEAHTLCTLFSSVEHAIFIGDPLQLRPQVKEPALSMENENGRRYRLDESLFERLMIPMEPKAAPIPTSQLTIQRRMHPDIADISRATLYPYLKDHESTLLHPPVAGMVDRLYWLNHQQPEDRPDPRSSMAKSFSNAFEVEMVAELVQYLVRGNSYDLGDIAVLTPYNGQLAALSQRLSMTCSIWLSDKDRERLVDEGFLPAEMVGSGFKAEVDMIHMLRVTTIDNFQGEEAKVVIMSTVRSNYENCVGFLKTPNRINVACSRARDGFYIIGNAGLMSTVGMWNTTIGVFARKGMIGPSFRACCPRHPEVIYEIRDPLQFRHVSICQVPCRAQLACGHICKEKCHPASLHARIGCTEPCPKIRNDCGHQCTRTCGEKCGECTYPIPVAHPGCGHFSSMTCAEAHSGSGTECRYPVDTRLLPCGHYQDIRCSTRYQSLLCNEPCGQTLNCGHECTGLCSNCHASTGHSSCNEMCGKLQPCGHDCDAQCHQGACPPCQQPCQRSCEHGACSRICSKICDPCVKICFWECKHQGQCRTMCSLPCSRLPCSEPCTDILACGHVCPSLCGESCASICTECETGKFPDRLQMSLPCGHCFDVEELDEHVGVADFYDINDTGIIGRPRIRVTDFAAPTCPACRESLSGVRRYSIFHQIQSLPDNIDRMFAKFGRKMEMFEDELTKAESGLSSSSGEFTKQFRPSPLAGKKNQNLVRVRGNMMMEVQKKITDFRDEVVIPFEENAILLAAYLDNPKIFAPPVLPFELRFDLLYHKCRLVTLQEAVNMQKVMSPHAEALPHVKTLVDGLLMITTEQATDNIKALDLLFAKASSAQLKSLEVELRLVQISFYVVLRALGVKHDLDITASLQQVAKTCNRYRTAAGPYIRSYRLLKSFCDGMEPPRKLFGQETRQYWWKWGRHEVGFLTSYANGHPYSSKTFNGCPECEGKTAQVEPEPVDYSKYLQEDAFLAKMHMRAVS